MLKLEQLKVKGVRGIIDGPDLHFEGGGLLLCGDNGTGKSSYIDAIEKILTGNCSSLDGSGHNVSWRKQGSHIRSTESEIELTLADGTKKFVLTLDTDFDTLNKRLGTFLDAARQQSFVLRRRTLLDFIDAAPRERYQAIQGFLKLDEYTAFERSLKDLHKQVETKLKSTIDDRDEHKRILRERLNFGKKDVVNEAKCFEAINKDLSAIGVVPLSALNDLSSRLKDVDYILQPFKDMEALRQAQQLDEMIGQVPKINILVRNAEEYINARTKFIDEEIKLKGHFYAQVLEKGLAWIREDDLEFCPLCNNPISLNEVTAYVNARIAENQQLIQLKQKQAEAYTKFLNLLKRYRTTLKNIKAKWTAVFQSDFPDEFGEVVVYIEHLLELHKKMLPLSEIETSLTQISATRIAKIIQSLRETVGRKLNSFPDSTQYTQLSNIKVNLLAISTHLTEIQNIEKKIRHLENSKEQLRIIVDLAEKGRKKAVQKLLDSVVDTADEYFQKIHPGESIGNPTLKITNRGTGSIELISKFHTKTGDPRGHYSEGHVDSLGLCLFLAIRRIHHKQRPELSLLILDDVMHSVDANHRRATANLIFEEFNDHQIIITTHDPLWFEYLKIASRRSKAKFTQRRIATWSLEAGPVWGDHLSNYEWLTSKHGKKAKPADKVIKAGLLLEEMLQNLCNNLWISVPFKIKGDYTIDPLWTSFYSAAKKNKGFFAQAERCLAEIDELRNLRNWIGAHWNEWAQALTDLEAESFIQAVLDLRDYVYCDDCKQFIRRIAGLDGVWSCKRECKRYNKRL